MIKHIISSDGEKIVYNLVESKGAKKKKLTVVLLHGLGGDLSSWKNLVDYLSLQGFNCLSIDLRGHGFSSRPKGIEKYSFSRLAHDVAEIVLEEKLSKIIIISHCLGAIVAQHFVFDYPEKVSKLVMMTPLNKTFMWAKWLEKNHVLTAFGTPVLKILPNASLHRRYADLDYLNGKSDFSGRRIFSDLMRTSLKSYGHILFHVLKLDLSKKISQISSIPTLIIFGKKDKVVPLSVITEYQKNLPDAKIVTIESANHQLLMTGYDQVLENLQSWL